jgi:predicted cupin superfamily sugar epimerase
VTVLLKTYIAMTIVKLSAGDVIATLGLLPHPEGGHYAETFRARALPFAIPARGERSASTAIYFLLAGGDFSALHVVLSDEIWHHYLGDALELHCFDEAGAHRCALLGVQLPAGERPQHVVRAGELQAARVLAGPNGFALCGCTVAPGFDFADFQMPTRAELITRLPQHRELITALTR